MLLWVNKTYVTACSQAWGSQAGWFWMLLRRQMKYCSIQFGAGSGLGTHSLHDPFTSYCPTCRRCTDLAWPRLPSSKIAAFFIALLGLRRTVAQKQCSCFKMFFPPTLWDTSLGRSEVLPCRWLAWCQSPVRQEAEDIRAELDPPAVPL